MQLRIGNPNLLPEKGGGGGSSGNELKTNLWRNAAYNFESDEN
jgi:hypothetical protein